MTGRKAARLRLTVDHKTIMDDGMGFCYVTIEMTDVVKIRETRKR